MELAVPFCDGLAAVSSNGARRRGVEVPVIEGLVGCFGRKFTLAIQAQIDLSRAVGHYGGVSWVDGGQQVDCQCEQPLPQGWLP